MHTDTCMLILRNMLLVQLLVLLAPAGNMPICPQELHKIWQTLNTPLFPKRSTKTNHKSGSFWEIDMTKFEP